MFLAFWSVGYMVGCSDARKTACDFDAMRAVVREGDIAFRRGTGITSRAVLAADKEGAYSHTGIVVRVPSAGLAEGDGEWRVVHIVPGERDANGVKDVIKAERLEEFFAPDRAVEGALMRLEEGSEAGVAARDGAVEDSAEGVGATTGCEAVDAEAGFSAGEDAGVETGVAAERGVTVAARAAHRALALAATELAFDHDYDLDDTTRMYCTELLHYVFSREGMDITEGRRSRVNAPAFGGYYILPTDIQRNQRIGPVYKF
ncbi:MAG: hypothetical protein LBV18_00370 [Alistipes sp.]|jgi:hypothetical protein|nr:hypothetical protein [Alistipes sp.]